MNARNVEGKESHFPSTWNKSFSGVYGRIWTNSTDLIRCTIQKYHINILSHFWYLIQNVNPTFLHWRFLHSGRKGKNMRDVRRKIGRPYNCLLLGTKTEIVIKWQKIKLLTILLGRKWVLAHSIWKYGWRESVSALILLESRIPRDLEKTIPGIREWSFPGKSRDSGFGNSRDSGSSFDSHGIVMAPELGLAETD